MDSPKYEFNLFYTLRSKVTDEVITNFNHNEYIKTPQVEDYEVYEFVDTVVAPLIWDIDDFCHRYCDVYRYKHDRCNIGFEEDNPHFLTDIKERLIGKTYSINENIDITFVNIQKVSI